MLEEIVRVKAALSEAIQNKDASKANNLYADHCVLFLLAPPLQEKIQAGIMGENDLDNWFATFEGNIELSSAEVEIVCDHSIAYLHSLEHLAGHRKDGSYTDIWYRETLCFSKKYDTWKITHQHQSFPMYMDGSDRAATDLKP